MIKAALKVIGLGVAGAALFVSSYVGFAKAVGADMSRLKVVGALFEPLVETAGRPAGKPPAQRAEREPALPEELARNLRTPQRAASIIDFFTVQAPFTADELKTLSDELLASAERLELRERELGLRERELEERRERLDEDFATLVRMQSSLDERASELRQREAEVQRDMGVTTESKTRVHEQLGELFQQGDVDDLVDRLTTLEPQEAAQVLATLPPERANELLSAIDSEERWLQYAEAFAEHTAQKIPPQ